MKRTLSVFSKTVSVQNFANRLSPFFADPRNLSDNLQVKIVSKAGQNFHSDFLRDFGKTASFRRFGLAIRETDFFRVPHFAREKSAKSKNRIDKETLNKSIYDLAEGFFRQARKMARRRSIATSNGI